MMVRLDFHFDMKDPFQGQSLLIHSTHWGGEESRLNKIHLFLLPDFWMQCDHYLTLPLPQSLHTPQLTGCALKPRARRDSFLNCSL